VHPGQDRLEVGRHRLGHPVGEGVEGGPVAALDRGQHRHARRQRGPDHRAKAAALGLLLAELVDDQQVGPRRQRAFRQRRRRLERAGVDPAAARAGAEVLADPHHPRAIQRMQVHLAQAPARQVDVVLHRARQPQPRRAQPLGRRRQQPVALALPLGRNHAQHRHLPRLPSHSAPRAARVAPLAPPPPRADNARTGRPRCTTTTTPPTPAR
jgi:hypothetical protein